MYQSSQDSKQIAAVVLYQRSDSKHGVDIVGMYVENQYGKNRECHILIQFDNGNICETMISTNAVGGLSDF